MPFLTPGRYDVRAELSGFKVVEQKGVTVALGQALDLPLKLEVGGVSETVQVVGTTDVVNVNTTTTGATITSDLLERVPVGRDIGSTLYLAPGVSSSSTAGHANPSIAGGSGLDNQYVIDGVNVTNQGYGALGSYSIIFGSLGNATPFDFMQEIQVKTGGYEAEYGQATGGVVNVITKSGSNNVRGSGFGYWRPDQLESPWSQFQSTNGSVQTVASRQYDAGLEAGAPIVRDRLFFFGAIDPGQEVRTLHAPAGFPLESMGDVDRIRKTLTYSSKATWQVGGRHRVDVSLFGDPSKGDNGPQRTSSLLNEDTSSFSGIEYGGHNQTVRYNGVLGNAWLLEATFARALSRLSETPSVNQWRQINTTVTPNVVTGGIGLYEDNRSLNYQYALKSTNVFGGHQLRYGVEYDNVDYSQFNNRTGPTFVAPDGRTTATGAEVRVITDPTFGRIFRVSRANFNLGRATTQRYTSLFVQDSWHATDRLTVNPGLRYEQETLAGTLVDNFTLKNNWAPRIGVTYDVTGDARTKLFARPTMERAEPTISMPTSRSRFRTVCWLAMSPSTSRRRGSAPTRSIRTRSCPTRTNSSSAPSVNSSRTPLSACVTPTRTSGACSRTSPTRRWWPTTWASPACRVSSTS
jgi:outer membrane receptor protein involved in Fe transport